MKAEDIKERYFLFDHREIVEHLIRQQGIHEGLWRILFELGLSATNVNVLNNGRTTLTPSGIVLIQRIGIVKASEESDLTVDAAIVNPRETPPSSKRRKRREK